jgi:hypothetical protein
MSSSSAANTTTTTAVSTSGAAAGSTVAAPSTAAAATSQSTPGQQDLVQTYDAILEPANEALGTFVTQASAWTDRTTNEQAATQAAPLIAAIQQAHDKLLRVQWPASAQADVNKLVRDFGALTGDLAALSTLHPLSALSHFTIDASKAGPVAAILRQELSAPSASG